MHLSRVSGPSPTPGFRLRPGEIVLVGLMGALLKLCELRMGAAEQRHSAPPLSEEHERLVD